MILVCVRVYQSSRLSPPIGASYPNAVGHNDGNDEAMPVEESGNMVIMSLNYAKRTGDLDHLNRFVSP